MSESSGPQTFNVDTLGKWKTGSCGPLVPGAHLKINNPDEKGEGEVKKKTSNSSEHQSNFFVRVSRFAIMVATCSWAI